MYIVSIGDLPEPVTVLQCQSQSHLPRPASVHSAKPPSHLSLSNHLLEFNLTVFFVYLRLPCLLSGTFRRVTFYVSLFHGFFKDCL